MSEKINLQQAAREYVINYIDPKVEAKQKSVDIAQHLATFAGIIIDRIRRAKRFEYRPDDRNTNTNTTHHAVTKG